MASDAGCHVAAPVLIACVGAVADCGLVRMTHAPNLRSSRETGVRLTGFFRQNGVRQSSANFTAIASALQTSFVIPWSGPGFLAVPIARMRPPKRSINACRTVESLALLELQ